MHQLLKRFLGLRRRFQSSASKTSLSFFFLGLSSFRNTMMRSSHLDLHHQEELHGFSSSGGAVPAFCDLATNREWNQNQILSCDDFISNANAVLSSQRDFSLIHGVSPVKSHMIPDLGFHWAINKEEGFMNQLPAHQLHLAKIKEGLLENSFRKLNGFYKDPSINEDYQLHEKLVSRILPSDCQIDGLQPLPGNLSQHSSFGSCGGDQEISMNFPTTHLSHSGLHPPLLSGSLDMDLHAMDLLASARSGRSFCQPSFFTDMSLLRGDASSGLDHLQESIQGPFYHHHKMPSLVSGVAEAKGSNSTWEHNSSHAASRKPQFEQRSSFSPFKVRKEKLGDRIAALQQLVAPFGKTDTASVLMEAIGYIKFLLEQVEKLSVPYMRSSGNKRSRTMQEASNDEESNNIEALKLDLRSRGLCLVPLSCTSYMTTEHVVWSP